MKKIEGKIDNYNNGIILLNKKNNLSHKLDLNKFGISTQEIYENEEVILLKWKKL